MSYKTILVHLANDPQHTVRLDTALELARRFQAQLVALYVTSPIGMPAAIAGRGASMGYLAEATAVAREKADALQAEFSEHCRKHGVAGEWRTVAGEHLDEVSAHATAADLVVVSQTTEKTLEDHVSLHIVHNAMMVTGCPVLVLPRGDSRFTPGRRVLLAWKPTKQCLRAVRDALPFLTEAEKVVVMTVDAPESGTPGADIAGFLARHGANAEVRSEIGADSNAGEVIVRRAQDYDCDMIVMGAYGHSRLRELILGGATRHVLHHAPVPVLMSH